MTGIYTFFVFSDVHGEYESLIETLSKAGYDPSNTSHKLVSLGDNFDRGTDSRRVLKFLIDHKAYMIKGNHEEFLEQFLDGREGQLLVNIFYNGLKETLESFLGRELFNTYENSNIEGIRNNIMSVYPKLLSNLQNMPLYFETDHYIFVHAGISDRIDWKNTDKDFMLWDVEHSADPLEYVDKIVVIGHHHAEKVREIGRMRGQTENDQELKFLNILSYGNTDENRPYCYGNKIAIDGKTNLTHKVNVLVIRDSLSSL